MFAATDMFLTSKPPGGGGGGSGAGFGQTIMSPPTGYTSGELAFQDTFQGTTLNLAKWSPNWGGNGILWNNDGSLGNDSNGYPYTGPNTPTSTEDELFVPCGLDGAAGQTLAVNNGLTITTYPNTTGAFTGAPLNPGGVHYQCITGCISSVRRPGYGPGETANFALPSTGKWYVQVRCKNPNMIAGVNPVLWFMPAYSGGNSNELDFIQGGLAPGSSPNANYYPCYMEYFSGSDPRSVPDVGFDSTAAFHIYGIELSWDANTIKFYADGSEIWSVSQTLVVQQYQIQLNNLQWLNTGYSTQYDGSTVSAWEIAEVQAYSTT